MHADLKPVESHDADTEQTPLAVTKPPRARPNWSEVETRQLIIDRQEGVIAEHEATIASVGAELKEARDKLDQADDALAYERQAHDAASRVYRKTQWVFLGLGLFLGMIAGGAWL